VDDFEDLEHRSTANLAQAAEPDRIYRALLHPICKGLCLPQLFAKEPAGTMLACLSEVTTFPSAVVTV
jgi:hypothetical protein